MISVCHEYVVCNLLEIVMRICPLCVIRWDVDYSAPESKKCPKCGNSQFLTMNPQDSVTMTYFDQIGDTLDRYQHYEIMP